LYGIIKLLKKEGRKREERERERERERELRIIDDLQSHAPNDLTSSHQAPPPHTQHLPIKPSNSDSING
jgi:hypothetical protein